jgi:hypothetical protein
MNLTVTRFVSAHGCSRCALALCAVLLVASATKNTSWAQDVPLEAEHDAVQELPQEYQPTTAPPTTAASAPATGPAYTKRDIVVAYNTGVRWMLAPGIGFAGNGDVAFTLGGSVGYGIETGPVILVPGAMANAYFFDTTVLTVLGAARVVVPIGGFAPYIEGGVGPGFTFSPSDQGLAWHAGTGASYYFNEKLAMGAFVGYDAIEALDFHIWSFGPLLTLGF